MPRADTYPGALDRLPSGSWRWRVSVEGERQTETWDDDLTEEEAASKARTRYNELQAQVARGDGAEIRLSRLVTVFKAERLPGLAESTQRAYGITLRALQTYYGERDPRLTGITRGDIKSFVSWRRVHGPDGSKRSEPLSGWSLQRTLGTLSSLFSEGMEREWIGASPTRRVSVEVPDKDPVILSQQEYDTLLEKAEGRPMLRTFILLAGEAGLRRSEAFDLRWGDLDFAGGFLEVVSGRDGRSTKSKRSRSVPMTSRLRSELRDHAARFRLQTYEGRRSPYVVHHVARRGGAGLGAPFTDMGAGLATVAEEAGLPSEWRYHDLRHRRCTRWLAEGHSPALVRKVMGHASLATTLKYEHLVRSDLEGMVGEDDRSELAEMVG